MTDLEKYFHYTNTGTNDVNVAIKKAAQFGSIDKVEVSYGDGNWEVGIDAAHAEKQFVVNPEATIFFRSNSFPAEVKTEPYMAVYEKYHIYFDGDDPHGEIGGSILSLGLYDSDGHSQFPTEPFTLGYGSFHYVFCESWESEPEVKSLGITDISEEYPLILAHNLIPYCYLGLLSGTGIESVPENLFDNIEDTIVPEGSFMQLFGACPYLKEVPSNLLKKFIKIERMGCAAMFLYDSMLTQAPYLFATDLGGLCYQSMFEACTSLKKVHVSFRDWPANNVTKDWLKNVASEGTIYVPLAFAGDTPESYNNPNRIPTGWSLSYNYKRSSITFGKTYTGCLNTLRN